MDVEALLDHRDQLERWAVTADALELSGDARGPLMSLMVARERTPTVALDEAWRATEQQRTALTPDSLRTLSARGHPGLAPVWRRGVIDAAGAESTSDFEALLTLPLLDRVSLLVPNAQVFAEWSGRVQAALSWRELEVTCEHGELRLEPLLAQLPRLTSLTVRLRDNPASFGDAASPRRVRLESASAETVASLCQLTSVRELLLTDPHEAALPTLFERRWWSRLERLTLEGALPADARALLRAPVSAGPLLTCMRVPHEQLEPSTERVRFVAATEALETAFLVVEHGLPLAPIVALARLVGLTQLAVASAMVELGGRTLTVARFHGAGEVGLVPRTLAAHLAEKEPGRRFAAFTLSRSNDAASSWAVGAHLAVKGKRSGVRRHDEAFFRHQHLVRETLEAMLGFDPGPDALERLLARLDFEPLTPLLGSLEPAPALFTDAAAIPPEDERDEYDQDDEFGDEDDDDREVDYDDGSWAPNEWGEAPEAIPDPVMIELPAATAEAEPVLVESEEDEDDERTFDAFDADEAEVWTEGPAELHEDWVDLPGDDLVNADAREHELVATDPEGFSTTCARCQAFATVRRCESCADEVCRECVAESRRADFDEERPVLCASCGPA